MDGSKALETGCALELRWCPQRKPQCPQPLDRTISVQRSTAFAQPSKLDPRRQWNMHSGVPRRVTEEAVTMLVPQPTPAPAISGEFLSTRSLLCGLGHGARPASQLATLLAPSHSSAASHAAAQAGESHVTYAQGERPKAQAQNGCSSIPMIDLTTCASGRHMCVTLHAPLMLCARH